LTYGISSNGGAFSRVAVHYENSAPTWEVKNAFTGETTTCASIEALLEHLPGTVFQMERRPEESGLQLEI